MNFSNDKLGKLGMAILEGFVGKNLGNAFIDELKAEYSQHDKVILALGKTEKRFIAEHSDKELSRALFVDLSTSDLPSMQTAVLSFYKHPIESEFFNALKPWLLGGLMLDKTRAEAAISDYVMILTVELALSDETFRKNRLALAGLHNEKVFVEILSILKEMAKTDHKYKPLFSVGGSVGGNIIIGDNISIQSAPITSLPPSVPYLPLAPADFTGRAEQIAAILASFRRRHDTAINGITGMGGVGKTALGLMIAHKLETNYPDGQVLVDLKGTTTPLSPSDVARQIIHAFEPMTDLVLMDENSLLNKYRQILSRKKALVFLDNVRDAAQVQPLLPPHTCALLITSRWVFPLAGLKSFHLETFNQNEAQAFLLKLCGRIGGEAAELAMLCGYLPLALRLAGSYVSVNAGVDIKDYILQLKTHRLESLKKSHTNSDINEPEIEATIRLSYKSLTKAHQKYWRKLVVFAGSFTIDAAAAIWDMDGEATEDLLHQLCRYSLLDEITNIKRFRLHDLLFEFGARYLKKQEWSSALLDHAFYYANLHEMADDICKKGNEGVIKGLQVFDNDWDNIQAGHNFSVEIFNLISEASYSNTLQIKIARLCSCYIEHTFCIDLRLNPREQIEWLKIALLASKFLKDRSIEWVHLGNLAISYMKLGEIHKAIDFTEQAISISRERLDQHGEGVGLTQLSSAYALLGDISKAIDFGELALNKMQETGDKIGEGMLLGNLGTIYLEINETSKGINFIERSLSINRETGDILSESEDLSNLGLAYLDSGETSKAIEYFEKALRIQVEIGNKIGEGMVLGNLGLANQSQGDTSKAIEFYEQALCIIREIGDQRLEYVYLVDLGRTYADLGDYRKAIDFYEKAMTSVRKINHLFGEKSILGCLAIAYDKLREIQTAIGYYEQALAINNEVGNRRDNIGLLKNLGGDYFALGETNNAINIYAQLLSIAKDSGDLRDEGNTLTNLGIAYADLGDLERAIDFHKRALDIDREIDDQQNEISDLIFLGNMYDNLGEQKEAIEFYEQALIISRKIADRRAEGNALGNLGIAYKRLGEIEKAIDFNEQALTLHRETGSRHDEGLDLKNLGDLYAELGKGSLAISSYEDALTIFRKIGNQQHVGLILDALTEVCTALGETQKAKKYNEQRKLIALKTDDDLLMDRDGLARDPGM